MTAMQVLTRSTVLTPYVRPLQAIPISCQKKPTTTVLCECKAADLDTWIISASAQKTRPAELLSRTSTLARASQQAQTPCWSMRTATEALVRDCLSCALERNWLAVGTCSGVLADRSVRHPVIVCTDGRT